MSTIVVFSSYLFDRAQIAYRMIKDQYWYAFSRIWKYQSVDRMGTGEGPTKRITNFFNYPTEILKGLYIGNIYNAADIVTLNDLNIKTVVNVSRNITNYFPSNFNYLNIKIDDINSEQFGNELIEVIEKIKEEIDNDKNVFVHCLMGSSRSATVIMMYLIINENLNVTDAYSMIKEKRNTININKTFMEQIENYVNNKKLLSDGNKKVNTPL